MRVLVVGAGGAIGTRLVPRLVERGHEVVGSSRSAEKAERLRALGAEPIVLDALDVRRVREVVLDRRPDAIVHQATALTGLSDFKHFDESFAETNRLRTRGTDALLAAAREAGVRRVVAQSYACHRYAREGGPVKTEADPLDADPVPAMRETVAAMRHLDDTVVAAGGVALRYGAFYGAPDDALLDAVRARRFPIVGDGGAIWSFIHLDDAAAATVLGLERDLSGVYNVVDDEPAPVRDWLPALAQAIGAAPPRRYPRLLARVFAGAAPVVMGTESRGASNAKARRELGWRPQFASWRSGFPDAFASLRAAP